MVGLLRRMYVLTRQCMGSLVTSEQFWFTAALQVKFLVSMLAMV